MYWERGNTPNFYLHLSKHCLIHMSLIFPVLFKSVKKKNNPKPYLHDMCWQVVKIKPSRCYACKDCYYSQGGVWYCKWCNSDHFCIPTQQKTAKVCKGQQASVFLVCVWFKGHSGMTANSISRSTHLFRLLCLFLEWYFT